MQKEDESTPNNKSDRNSEHHHKHKTAITIPRYSDKFKDIMAKSKLTRKLAQNYE